MKASVALLAVLAPVAAGAQSLNLDQFDASVLSGTPYILVENNSTHPITKISCPGGMWADEYNISGLGASSTKNPPQIGPHHVAVVDFKDGGSHCDKKIWVRFKGLSGKYEAVGDGSNINESTVIIIDEPQQGAAK